MTAVTSKLYELADLRLHIDATLEETAGEITPDIAAALDRWEADFPQKVESCALYIVDLEGDAEKIKAEEERLAKRRSAILNRAEAVTLYVQSQMERAGVKKVEGVLKTVQIVVNNPRVEPLTLMDEAELRNIASWAPSLIRHEESWALDKKAVLEAHKAGTLDEDLQKRLHVVRTSSIRIR